MVVIHIIRWTSRTHEHLLLDNLQIANAHVILTCILHIVIWLNLICRATSFWSNLSFVLGVRILTHPTFITIFNSSTENAGRVFFADVAISILVRYQWCRFAATKSTTMATRCILHQQWLVMTTTIWTFRHTLLMVYLIWMPLSLLLGVDICSSCSCFGKKRRAQIGLQLLFALIRIRLYFCLNDTRLIVELRLTTSTLAMLLELRIHHRWATDHELTTIIFGLQQAVEVSLRGSWCTIK